MKPNRHPVSPSIMLAAGLLVLLVFCWRIQSAHAAPPLAPSLQLIPGNCVAHTTFVTGGRDYPDDYRCSGQAIPFHTAGVGHSPFPIWAGQWLLIDEAGGFRLGLCTFNRGIHPTIDAPSTPIAQALPNDPDGAKSAYLTWRYGQTTDDTLAAGLWAVFHYYAQDAAGSNRSANASAPLVPALSIVGAASGRVDLQELAMSLDAEAALYTSPFVMEISLSSDGVGRASVRSGANLVQGAVVRVEVTGAAFDDESTVATLTTDGAGSAAFEVVGPAQTVSVIAASTAPGPAQVYRAAAADPLGHVPQTLVTAGAPLPMIAGASIVLEAPSTTTEAPSPTTTEAPVPATTTPATPVATTTEVPPPPTTTTTTEVPPPPTTTTTTEVPSPPPTTTTTEELTTPVTTTTEIPATTTTEIPASASASTAPAPAPPEAPVVEQLAPPPETVAVPETAPEALPRTGSSSSPAYIATSLLVAGIGMIGAIRRRLRSDG